MSAFRPFEATIQNIHLVVLSAVLTFSRNVGYADRKSGFGRSGF